MEQWRKNVYLLWVAVIVASAAWSSIMPFMPVFLKEELGVTTGVSAWAGVLGAVNSLGMAVMSPVWGAMGDRYGRKMMMMRAGVSLVILYVLMAMVTGPYSLLAVRIALGMLTGFIPTATALVGTTTPQQHVGQALSIIATAGPTGMILGPALGGLLADLVGIRMTMVASGVGVAFSLSLVYFFVKEQFTPVVRSSGYSLVGDMREVLQHRTFAYLLVTCMLAMAGMSALEPIMVPYIKDVLGPGSANWLAGALYSLPGAAFVLAAPWWGARARSWGFGVTLMAGLGLGALVVLPQALAFSVYDFGGLRLAQGLATASVMPGIAAIIALVMPREVRGRAYGINQSATSTGMMIGPLLGGFVGSFLGAPWVFGVTAVLFGLAALWTRFMVAPRLPGGEKHDAA